MSQFTHSLVLNQLRIRIFTGFESLLACKISLSPRPSVSSARLHLSLFTSRPFHSRPPLHVPHAFRLCARLVSL